MYMRSGLLATMSVCLFVGTGHCASLTDYPPALQKATACMVEVLKNVPGVSSANTSVRDMATWRNSRPHPTLFVEYKWERARQTSGDGRYRPTVTFWTDDADVSDPTKIVFEAWLSGLSSLKYKGPDDLGTNTISRLWKNRCGIHVSIAYD
jgi:hypothetical protein